MHRVLLELEGIAPGDIVASFFTPSPKMGIGNGEMMLKVGKPLRDFLDQWGTIIERGWCAPKNYHDGNRDMTCMRRTLEANSSLSLLLSRARKEVFTDWFVRHCGGWNEVKCMKEGRYDRQMVRAGIGTKAAQELEWSKLAASSRVEMYGTMELEFKDVLEAGVFGVRPNA